jgi:hypothetical protein
LAQFGSCAPDATLRELRDFYCFGADNPMQRPRATYVVRSRGAAIDVFRPPPPPDIAALLRRRVHRAADGAGDVAVDTSLPRGYAPPRPHALAWSCRGAMRGLAVRGAEETTAASQLLTLQLLAHSAAAVDVVAKTVALAAESQRLQQPS